MKTRLILETRRAPGTGVPPCARFRSRLLAILAAAFVGLPPEVWAAHDLYMEDLVGDGGAQPSGPAGAVMWETPDIWVRQQPDPAFTLSTAASHPGLAGHQNPQWRDPRLSCPNFIYIRIRNKSTSTTASTGNEQLHLYWAKASTGLSWPLHWKDHSEPCPSTSTPLLFVGDEITKPRKKASAANAAELTKYINAVLAIDGLSYASDLVSYWDKQDEIHNSFPQHHNEAFLPWHREYLNRLEVLLRMADPSLTLLYWDWTLDPHSHDGLNLFSMLGSDSGTVGAPFLSLTASGSCTLGRETECTTDPIAPCCTTSPPLDYARPPVSLRRFVSSGVRRPCGVATSQVVPIQNQVMNMATFNGGVGICPSSSWAGSPALWTSSSEGFARTFENRFHDGSHVFIGGNMSLVNYAASDPFFFLLHGNVDRLWAKWQRTPGQIPRMRPATAYGTSTEPVLAGSIGPWDGNGGAAIFPWSNATGPLTPDLCDGVAKPYHHPSVIFPPIYDDALLVIPPIPPGQEIIIEIPWYPPNPSDYACFGDQSHFCLLARIEEPGLPAGETGDVYENTRQNNNIAWKNVNVAGPCLGMAESMAAVLVRNVADVLTPTELRFEAPAIQNLTLLSYGRVTATLHPELYRRWVAGGSAGQGIENLGNNRVEIFGPKASLLNVLLQPKDAFPIEMHFALDPNYAHPLGRIYTLQLTQLGFPGRPDLIVGGQQFYFDFNKIALVMDESIWKYWDTGANPGPNWASPNFDDKAWRTGQAPLGFGRPLATTIRSGPVTNRLVTAYFRHTFDVVTSFAFRRMLLRLKRDDGAVVYLNGEEVHRNNMPPGVVGPDTLAVAPIEGAAEEAFVPIDLTAALPHLRTGANLLAVEIHRVGGSNDLDLCFDLELCANQPLNYTEPPALEVTEPRNQALVLAGRPITVNADAFSPDSEITNVRFFDGAVPLATIDTPPYAFVWPNAAPGSHRLTIVASQLGASTVRYADVVVVSNLSPTITVTQPPHHAVLAEADTLNVAAVAADDGGTIRRVRFFLASGERFDPDPQLIGEDTTAPYGASLPAPAPGHYVVFAEAEDNAGVVQGSHAVHFSVTSKPRLVYDFNDCLLPPGTSFPGAGNAGRIADDGSRSNCVVHLTDANQANTFGVFVLPPPLHGGHVDSLHLHWRSLVGGDNGSVCNTVQFNRPGADGYSVSWGTDLPNPPSYGNPAEEGAGSGLSVTVDTFDNGGGEAPGLEVKWLGNRVAFDNINADPGLAKDFLRKGAFVEADLTVNANGQAVFTYDGRRLSATLPGWTGIHGGNIMFGARTGGACDNHWIDNLLIESGAPSCGANLKVARNGNDIIVAWEGGGILQSSTSLAPSNWAAVPGSPVGTYVTTAIGPARFYRVSCTGVIRSPGGSAVSPP